MNNLNPKMNPGRQQFVASAKPEKTKIHAAIFLVGSLLAFAAMRLNAQGVTNDVALDFSTNSNPNGVWTYGYATSLGSSLILYNDSGNNSGLLFWQHNLSLGAPSVVRNSTTNPFQGGTPVFGPGQAAFHPGPHGEYSMFRFTAPAADSYRLESFFVGCDTYGTTTDVHVLLNDTPVFNGTVNGYGAGTGPAFNTNLTLQAGDRVDFAVGYGNGSFYYDSTGISARLVRESPRLSITFADTNTVVVTWPLPASGWLLHATTNLVATGGGWTEIPPPYQTNGPNLQFTEPQPADCKLYRLHKP